MSNKKSNIWVGDKDLTRDETFISIAEQEFADPSSAIDVVSDKVESAGQSNRRDFLKFLGFGLGAATVAAGCDTPVRRAIPYVVKPEEIVPGVANYYASTFVRGTDFDNVLVKTREGRPIKVNGNNLSKAACGSSGRAGASVLDLYNTHRYRKPMKKVNEEWEAISWEDLDQSVMASLSGASNVRILSSGIISPSFESVLDSFKAKYNTEVVYTDPVSYSGILDANEKDFGKRFIPGYNFGEADLIVSFDADFLGTWVAHSEFNQAFIERRIIKDPSKPEMNRLIQVESAMSLTGSNADNRIMVKPSAMGEAIALIYSQIVGGSHSTSGLTAKAKSALTKVAASLRSNAGKCLVVSGSNNVAEQRMVNAINNALGNYGTTIDTSNEYSVFQGSENKLAALIDEMNSGKVDVLIVNQCNPVYDTALGAQLKQAMAKVPTRIAMTYSETETGNECQYLAPVHHYLESWSDAQPKLDLVSIIQPTISPLFNTRQPEVSLLAWSGNKEVTDTNAYYEYIRKVWRDTIFAQQSEYATFDGFWRSCVKDGLVYLPLGAAASYQPSGENLFAGIRKASNAELEISFYEPLSIGNGVYSDNPWLQEMPDPVTRTSWGNYLAVPLEFDGYNKFIGLNKLEDGDLAEITIGDKKITVPVIKQFGQMKGTVALALGYGRNGVGPSGRGIGVDVNDCSLLANGLPQYYNDSVSLSGKVGVEEDFSCVQYHHTFGVTGVKNGEEVNVDEEALGMAYGMSGYQGALTNRSIVYHSTIEDLPENIKMLKERRKHAQHLNEQQYYAGHDDLYSMGHHWQMHIDLNACTGCGACTIACMAENNIPIVGKKEVARHHEMTWLRIDRYFYGDVENPKAVYQPMMCQHCDNAPCENVCPVNATNHSTEGLNQMTYNRCIGTRYCANNCPYKVRRFNWLDYTTADLWPANQIDIVEDLNVPFGADNLTRMVLNPDVTVRSRGVIEKCSFCIQGIQEGKLIAKMEGRKLRDEDLKMACGAACPSGAITFGDGNDPDSAVSKRLEHNPLNYEVLEEVNLRPSITYTMKVTNTDESLEA